MERQVSFMYEGVKYVTLFGASDILRQYLITPKANVALYENCAKLSSSVMFSREFGQEISAVPFLSAMSVCRADENYQFTIHGSYQDGAEMRDVSVYGDRLIFHKTNSERKAEEAEQAARLQKELEEMQKPNPETADSNTEEIANAEIEDVPEPPVTDIHEPEPKQVVRTVGKRRRKAGMSFGRPKIQTVPASNPVVAGENVLASFPTPQKKETAPTVVVVPERKEEPTHHIHSTEAVNVTVHPNHVSQDTALKKMASGVSALEALGGSLAYKDSDLPDAIKQLAADKLEVLNSVPLHMLHMTAAFVPHRCEINFNELSTDGVDYALAHDWEQADNWYCCDILDSATRVFFNSDTNTHYEFKTLECTALYEQRRLTE